MTENYEQTDTHTHTCTRAHTHTRACGTTIVTFAAHACPPRVNKGFSFVQLINNIFYAINKQFFFHRVKCAPAEG